MYYKPSSYLFVFILYNVNIKTKKLIRQAAEYPSDL